MYVNRTVYMISLEDELSYIETMIDDQTEGNPHVHLQIVIGYILARAFPKLNPGIYIHEPSGDLSFFDYESLKSSVRLEFLRLMETFAQRLEALVRLHLKKLFDAPHDFATINACKIYWYNDAILAIDIQDSSVPWEA